MQVENTKTLEILRGLTLRRCPSPCESSNRPIEFDVLRSRWRSVGPASGPCESSEGCIESLGRRAYDGCKPHQQRRTAEICGDESWEVTWIGTYWNMFTMFFLWGYPLEKNVKRTSTRAFQSFQHFSTFSLWLANGLLSQFGRCESFPGIGHSYCRMTRHPAAVFGWAGDRERSRDWCTKGQMSRGTETPPK